MAKIKKISIIGVGFMGASLALAIRARFRSVSVWGYARSKRSFDNLKKLKVVDNVSQDLEAVVSDADLIIIATPVFSVVDYFKKIKSFLRKGSIVIDLGSTKSLIEKGAKKYLPKEVAFVGVHPLCGGNKNGPQVANENLYKKSICVISSPKSKSTKTIETFWKNLGAKVVYRTSLAHDIALSYVSHLPHLVAFSLTDIALKEHVKLAPASFLELTRFSSSSPEVWAEIFLSNKKNILKCIREYTKSMKSFEGLIKDGNKDGLCYLISSINKKHQSSKV